MTSTSTFPPPCVILNHPQMAENIGAVARVMANFGLEDLRLVKPRDGWPQERAWPSASGATWPLDNAKVFDTLAEAIADLKLVFATTARPRETRLPVVTPREAAAQLSDEVGQGHAVGLLFGGERAGLETDDIALCQAIISIPIAERFRSLNLAQAVSITAYEWKLTVDDRPWVKFEQNVEPPADQSSLLGLYAQLEEQLEEAGFYHPPEKKPSMVRNLRAPLARARLTEQEVRTFRGVVTALSRGRGRVLAKLAAQKAAKAAKSDAED
ncbi:RNA methyltransferase [soil metagenome]